MQLPNSDIEFADEIHASAPFSRGDIELTIPQRFTTIARQFPDHIAIKTPGQAVSYRELDAQAERVAGFILSKRGHGPEPIALLFDNGIPLTAAILGVLKAGKFFVLIDPTYPAGRCDAILRDVQAGLAISDREDILSRGEEQSACQLVQYTELQRGLVASGCPGNISPCDLAVIVYTSGSTGEPKGVIWQHRDLLHRVWLRTHEMQAYENDRIALLSSSAANTVTNIFLAVLNGATLLPFNVKKDGAAGLGRWLAAEHISICAISTPLFRKVCEASTDTDGYPNLRIIRLRSDTVRESDLLLFRRNFPAACALMTGLSTSESGQLTTYRVDPLADLAGGEVPVGYPVPDKEILLVNEEGQEVGIERIGEIVVRSRYLSVGYWRRADLTNSKFRQDVNDPATRLYHTGDLGLRLPDGCLLHKGRKDFRVKIRGYGVEIAEVERALERYDAVRHAVVVTRQNDCGEARLIGYFTTRGETTPSASQLRTFMSASLPDYMVPSAFIKLDTIPLMSNGKVDRQALPEPGNRRPALDSALVFPRTETERTLARVFSEVLDINPVGVKDNFFELGGDSLLATRLVSRIHQVFEIELPANQVFESPTLEEIASFLDAPLRKRSINAGPVSMGVGGTSLAPLSFAQQRLWFLDQLNPGDCAYNLISVFQIRGNLDAVALERSFNALIERHDALRTVIAVADGKAFQKILPKLKIGLRVVDLRELASPVQRDAEARRFCAAEAKRPFDLMRGPLMRICLLRQTDDNYLLLVTIHHIVFDGWSMGILCRELSRFYEAFVSGSSISLAPPNVQYADYAQWYRTRLQGDVLREDINYWRRQLQGLASLQLPTDHSRPPVQTSHGARKFFTLSEDLSTKIKKLAADCDATVFMTLLAAFQLLLHRYTGQTDVAVGCPVAGRNHQQVENLIGFFLNMLVLRSDLSGDPTFRKLLDRVRQVCLDAYARQDVPFEKLVEEIGPERDLGRNPFFQVTFGFQNTPQSRLELRGLSVSRLDVDAEIARFDLSLFMDQADGPLRGDICYNTNLFDAGSIDRMQRHFTNLLEAIVAGPDRRISALPLMADAEQRELVGEWSAADGEHSPDKCIHELFEAQVEKDPEAIALIFGERRWSYRELNCRANQLAHYLRSRGVGPETLVAISVRRSGEMIVAILGTLKAGGAYVPLDPAYPRERISFILRDAQASVLLTEECLLDDFAAYRAPGNGAEPESSCGARALRRFPLQLVCLDKSWREISEQSGENLTEPADPQNLAYVIYTSGSTGFPKGVMIEHRNAAAFLHWAHRVFTEDDLAGVVASTSICFDLSLFEIFAPLTAGGRVILVENALALADLDSGVAPALVNTVPSVMAELLRLGNLPASIRTVNLAGEALRTSLVQEIYQQTSARHVYDLYGPSETTTYSTYGRRTDDGVQTIGRPIANTQIYILDPHGNPAPIGVPGEIYIGGAGLARGYLNRPELTAEKFLADPFSIKRGARLYRTGDTARYLPGGNIEFIGRKDDQVKLRGFRIELGEIEAVLNRHTKVREAAVIARENYPGGKRLVAYVVGHEQEDLELGELKQFVRAKLPDYMMPSVWVRLASLPHTPNGKINRSALPDPEPDQLDAPKELTLPRTEVEKGIAGIWAEVLEVERVSVDDNFFDLGGHSLLATQVISRLCIAFNTEIPLRSIFECPTIERLAAAIVRLRISEATHVDITIADSQNPESIRGSEIDQDDASISFCTDE